MAASHTLSYSPAIPQIPKHGILTLYGYGVRVTMQSGHLQIKDGIGPERRKCRLPRVGHGLRRLVCISEDGFVTLSALRWLSDVGASFVMLDRLGKIRVVTGPTSPSEARLRRAQALALGNGTGLRIARELIAAKVSGQETLVREKLKNDAAANTIAARRDRLANAESIDAIRVIESQAAAEYWRAWYDLPILFPRKDVSHVPTHWLRFGTRHSPLTGGPRLSVNPANSLLNYANAVAESECRLAATVCGLDPGLGFVHTDTANRDSLALDLIETIRPSIEAWLLDWLMQEPLRRSDFFETANGNCRISSGLCSKLSETAPTWGRLVAPWAEFVAHSLHAGRASRCGSTPGLKTPLTQTHRRKAKGASVPKLKIPKTEHVCRGCGKPIPNDCDHCVECSVTVTRSNFERGRKMAHNAESLARASKTSKVQAARVKQWNREELPAWLTREFYVSQVVPALLQVTKAQIRSEIGVSVPYSIWIQRGERIPHARHWHTLAKLAGVMG